MPQYNRRELDVKAREYGFNRDTFRIELWKKYSMEETDTWFLPHSMVLTRMI